MKKEIIQDNGTITIKGNGRYTPLLLWEDLTDKEKKAINGMEEHIFFRYKKWVYCLSDFMRIDPHAPSWMQAFDGYCNDTFFSGIVVKISEDTEYLKAYTFYS